MTKAQVIINRCRIGTDGPGVRTLLSFVGCQLDCAYCLNPEIKRANDEVKWYTPQQLWDEVKKDMLYFELTSGGVTFSGGEPLLHAGFIKEFIECTGLRRDLDTCWFAMETSLYAPTNNLMLLKGLIDKYYVDIKDMNPSIYLNYTGKDINLLMRNLEYLAKEVSWLDDIIFRVPLIPNYNDRASIVRSKTSLHKILRDNYGYVQFNEFEYMTDMINLPAPDGKITCERLKSIRKACIDKFKIPIRQQTCTNKGNCPGYCNQCDHEVSRIEKVTDALGYCKKSDLKELVRQYVGSRTLSLMRYNIVNSAQLAKEYLITGMIAPVHPDWCDELITKQDNQ